MGGLDGWWTGLRPGDRRLVALFLGIIILTVPFYVLALRPIVGSGTGFAAALGRGAATPTPGALSRPARSSPGARRVPCSCSSATRGGSCPTGPAWPFSATA